MTREETIKILAILKAAYPNSYRNMSKEEANGTVTVWTMHFAKVPANVVMLAINKLISTSQFPPAICEVKDKIGNMYWEVWGILADNKQYKTLSPEQEAMYKKMLASLETIRQKSEPTIVELMSGSNKNLLN